MLMQRTDDFFVICSKIDLFKPQERTGMDARPVGSGRLRAGQCRNSIRSRPPTARESRSRLSAFPHESACNARTRARIVPGFLAHPLREQFIASHWRMGTIVAIGRAGSYARSTPAPARSAWNWSPIPEGAAFSDRGWQCLGAHVGRRRARHPLCADHEPEPRLLGRDAHRPIAGRGRGRCAERPHGGADLAVPDRAP